LTLIPQGDTEVPTEFIWKNILTIAIAAISGGMLVWFTLRKGGKALSPALATQLMNREDALVIDVREAHEYTVGHLPGARNIPLKDIKTRAGDLEASKDKPLILVCASGARSEQACVQLRKLGFSRLNHLDGGINAWERAGLPVTRGNKKK
jgi:rhodanese-related sulfurtransferase